MSTNRPHISATQVDMILKCPEQYRRRYVEGEIIPPGVSMLKGTGVHRGAEVNFRQKIETHDDLPASEIVDAAVEGFRAAVAGGYQLTADESGRGPKVVIGEATDAVAAMAGVLAAEVAPDYQPVAVEQAVRIELPGQRDLLGVIDLIDDAGRVVDLKTSRRKKQQADADDSTQLTIYAAAQTARGTPPPEVRLDVIVEGSKSTTRQVVSSTRGDADFRALAARLNVIQSTIDAGIFLPAPPGSWCCDPKWCGYYQTCPYVNGRRSADDEG